MHVRVAWEIYHHQHKGDTKPGAVKTDLLRPPTHLFSPSVHSTRPHELPFPSSLGSHRPPPTFDQPHPGSLFSAPGTHIGKNKNVIFFINELIWTIVDIGSYNNLFFRKFNISLYKIWRSRFYAKRVTLWSVSLCDKQGFAFGAPPWPLAGVATNCTQLSTYSECITAKPSRTTARTLDAQTRPHIGAARAWRKGTRTERKGEIKKRTGRARKKRTRRETEAIRAAGKYLIMKYSYTVEFLIISNIRTVIYSPSLSIYI